MRLENGFVIQFLSLLSLHDILDWRIDNLQKQAVDAEQLTIGRGLSYILALDFQDIIILWLIPHEQVTTGRFDRAAPVILLRLGWTSRAITYNCQGRNRLVVVRINLTQLEANLVCKTVGIVSNCGICFGHTLARYLFAFACLDFSETVWLVVLKINNVRASVLRVCRRRHNRIKITGGFLVR